jgi:hypothetical protein
LNVLASERLVLHTEPEDRVRVEVAPTVGSLAEGSAHTPA